jgi:hypothetical protein
LAVGDLVHSQVEGVQRPNEVRYESRRRTLVDLSRPVDLLGDTFVHDCDPVRHRERLFLVVRHVDERGPKLALNALQLELHLFSQLEIEGTERLVQEERGGPVDECARECDSLLLPARELSRFTLLEPLEPDDAEHLLYALLLLPLRHPLQPECERNVVEDRHMWEKRVVLEHHVHVPPVRRRPGHIGTTQENASLVWLLETGDHAEGRRLPAAAWTEQREELAFLDIDGQGAHRLDFPEALADVLEGDAHGFGHAPSLTQ